MTLSWNPVAFSAGIDQYHAHQCLVIRLGKSRFAMMAMLVMLRVHQYH